MHGLGLSLWIGEDLTKTASSEEKPKSKSKTITTFDLDIGDANWKKVLTYVAQNKHLGLPKIVKNLEQKYKIKASVKKELSKHV